MNIYEFHNNPSVLLAYDRRHTFVPKLVYEKIVERKAASGTEAEESIIATSPTYSYLYAKDVLKTPFPKGEKAISLNPRRSFRYAKDVLGYKRFQLGEPAIFTDAAVSIQYAKVVMKGRILEVEPLIISKFGKSCLEEMTEFDKTYIQTYFSIVPIDEVDSFLQLLPVHLVEMYHDEFSF